MTILKIVPEKFTPAKYICRCEYIKCGKKFTSTRTNGAPRIAYCCAEHSLRQSYLNNTVRVREQRARQKAGK